MKTFTEANAEAKKLVEALDKALLDARDGKQVAEALDAHRVDLVITLMQCYQAGRTDGIREASE